MPGGSATSRIRLGHRYYDSSTGRFLTRDPAKDGRHWYGYCAGNPVGKVDFNGNRWTWLYELYEEATMRFLKNGTTRRMAARKAEHAKRFGFAVELRPIKGFQDDIPEHVRYGPQNREALDEERARNMVNPGPYNRERYLRGPRGGLGVTVGTAALLKDYDNEIERTSKKDWGIWEYIPYIGDAIMAGEWLGEWGNELGRESRASRAAAFDIALSED
ncbi:MAG: hypothetical protein JSS71_06950 [Armatimonadetes bacterium]|nr:hypothetical protein [Armatimonadota bacterium]MBX3107631.1 hypothetical protein [Fimbriimonadaceae bacterium]